MTSEKKDSNVSNLAPVVFVGHGSPMNAIGDNKARPQWARMGEQLGKPRAIVAVSAHWLTAGQCVRRHATNPQVNDMYGFPQALYEVKYSPAGDVQLADAVLDLLGSDARVDNNWGIDHGAWSVLCNMYPDADVPVVPVSVDGHAAARHHLEVGERLRSLREQGVMILCSGNVVHNLGRVNWRMRDGYEWADKFDIMVHDAVVKRDVEALVNYDKLPDSHLAIPTAEHYMPLLTALGASAASDRLSVWNDYRELGSMSMTCYLWQG